MKIMNEDMDDFFALTYELADSPYHTFKSMDWGYQPCGEFGCLVALNDGHSFTISVDQERTKQSNAYRFAWWTTCDKCGTLMLRNSDYICDECSQKEHEDYVKSIPNDHQRNK
jgi:hypothetical protein